MIGQAGRHRWRARLPLLGGAHPVDRLGRGQRLAEAPVGQHAMARGVAQGQLRLHTVFALVPGVDPTSHRRHALPPVQGEPLHKGRGDRPAAACSDLRDGLQCAAHHPRLAGAQARAPVRVHHLRLPALRQRQPTGLGRGPLGPLARRLVPAAKRG